jgi:hypothetical protein
VADGKCNPLATTPPAGCSLSIDSKSAPRVPHERIGRFYELCDGMA